MKHLLASLVIAGVALTAAAAPAPAPSEGRNTHPISYPTTTFTFYGEAIDLSKDWNICTGRCDGGVEVKMVQEIRPIENAPDQYVVIRTYTDSEGRVLKRTTRRLSDYGSVPLS